MSPIHILVLNKVIIVLTYLCLSSLLFIQYWITYLWFKFSRFNKCFDQDRACCLFSRWQTGNIVRQLLSQMTISSYHSCSKKIPLLFKPVVLCNWQIFYLNKIKLTIQSWYQAWANIQKYWVTFKYLQLRIFILFVWSQ